MRIHFDEAHRLFHLRTSEMSYAFGIAADGRLRHLPQLRTLEMWVST